MERMKAGRPILTGEERPDTGRNPEMDGRDGDGVVSLVRHLPGGVVARKEVVGTRMANGLSPTSRREGRLRRPAPAARASVLYDVLLGPPARDASATLDPKLDANQRSAPSQN